MSIMNNRGCLSIFFGGNRHKKEDISFSRYQADRISYPYKVSKRFLSESEHSFYLVAKKVLGEHYMVCPQVSLSAVFIVTTHRSFWSDFHRISQKRVDFIVCDALTMQILFGIELDDSSHQRPDRVERDDFVNHVFQFAGLPLVRVKAKNTYSTGDLEGLFSDAILPVTLPMEKPKETPIKPVESSEIQNHEICPTCGSRFTIRVSTAGPNVGHKFYVCSQYPECKTRIKID